MNLEKTINNLSQGVPTTIVALGDSLTHGWMVPKGYIDFLKEMLLAEYPDSSFTIINKGIPGDTASGGFSRLDQDVLQYKPDLTLIQFALNDMFVGYSPEDFSRNIESIIQQIQEKTQSEILITTSVSLEEKHEREISETFYSRLQQLANTYNTALTEVHSYWDEQVSKGVVSRDSLVQSDRVHPTVTGYKLMAEAIIKVF